MRCGKATNWDGGVRVPALIHWKDAIQPRKSNELFSALDVVPTFMKIVGHPIENNGRALFFRRAITWQNSWEEKKGSCHDFLID